MRITKETLKKYMTEETIPAWEAVREILKEKGIEKPTDEMIAFHATMSTIPFFYWERSADKQKQEEFPISKDMIGKINAIVNAYKGNKALIINEREKYLAEHEKTLKTLTRAEAEELISLLGDFR